jgi:hypothetical protein
VVQIANFDTTSSHTFAGATTNTQVGVNGPGGTDSFSDQATAGPVSGTATIGLSVTSFSGLTNSGSQNFFIGPGDLSAYQGSGPGALSFAVTTASATYGGSQTDGSGSLFFGGTANVGSSLMVTYTYETAAVPEPGTFVIIGSGLVGLAVLVRRRRKAA